MLLFFTHHDLPTSPKARVFSSTLKVVCKSKCTYVSSSTLSVTHPAIYDMVGGGHSGAIFSCDWAVSLQLVQLSRVAQAVLGNSMFSSFLFLFLSLLPVSYGFSSGGTILHSMSRLRLAASGLLEFCCFNILSMVQSFHGRIDFTC